MPFSLVGAFPMHRSTPAGNNQSSSFGSFWNQLPRFFPGWLQTTRVLLKLQLQTAILLFTICFSFIFLISTYHLRCHCLFYFFKYSTINIVIPVRRVRKMPCVYGTIHPVLLKDAGAIITPPPHTQEHPLLRSISFPNPCWGILPAVVHVCCTIESRQDILFPQGNNSATGVPELRNTTH